VQIFFAVVAPLAFGALCGYELGRSQTVFQVLMLLAGIGGVAAGFEHPGPRPGVVRGFVGGALFVGALVATFEIRGLPALAPMPIPLPITALIYAAMGMPLGALGGWLRARSIARAAA
jgi:hypothetical protein